MVEPGRRRFGRWSGGVLGLWLFATVLVLLGAAIVQTQPDVTAGRGATRVVMVSDFNESYGSIRYSAQVAAAVAR